LCIDKEIGNRYTPTLKTTPHEELTMYELIQSALTAAAEVIAIAGIAGIAALAIWKQHTNWMAAYYPPIAAYTGVEEEVAISQPEPEVVAIADPWEAPITTSSRRWISRQPESIKPVLVLCPAKEEVKPVTKPQPTQIDLNALDAVTLRKLCSQHKIQWRDVRGKNRHATKAMMIFQLNQKAVA
jgi:hypothetical protein